MAIEELDLGKYQLGWNDAESYVFKPAKGINEQVVRDISWWKGEPDWMTKFRLRSLKHFERKPMNPWFASRMPNIDFNDIYYYIKPTEGGVVDEWDQVPEKMKQTYEKLGIPEAERKYLAGVTAQYESEVVYHRNREDLAAQGIIFCDMDTALREYPELVKQYFGTVIPPGDNKFAALNSAVWSGGSFIYVPPGVNCELPLQAYFRINSENAGQFERTLIIADEGAQVHYIEGCSAPVYAKDTDSLHSAVVELIAKKSARITYTTIQNWSNNVYNLVTKRGRADAEARIEWIDGNIGSKLTMKYPSVYLMGPKASGEVLSVAYAGTGSMAGRRSEDVPLRAGDHVHHRVEVDLTGRRPHHVPRPRARRRRRGEVEELRALRRADPRRGQPERHLPVHGGGRARRADRPRSHRLQDRQRAALLPDEPRPLRRAGDGHDRQRLHRADHAHAADGIRRRVVPPDRASDGRKHWLVS